MKTLQTDSIQDTADILRRGGLVAFPTETVYGLGANALDSNAVRSVFEAKGRPSDNPLIVHVASIAAASRIGAMTDIGAKLLQAFAPGPLTIVLETLGIVGTEVTAGGSTVAIRIPAHPIALALIDAAGVPVVAPSANRSGRPSPTTWRAVLEDLDGRVDAILKGNPSTVGLESTVVDATGEVPVLLRPGAITLEQLRAIVPEAHALADIDGSLARSPGLRHRHYSPTAAVRIADAPCDLLPSANAAFIGLLAPPAGYGLSEQCDSVEQLAQRLFDFFRRADAAGMIRIDAMSVPETGLGVAVMDRLRRAARD